MAWTELTRAQHNRKTERYPSDLTDEEWAVVCPLLPGPNRLGRPRTVDLRQVWNAIQYIAASGCAWSFAIALEPVARRWLIAQGPPAGLDSAILFLPLA